MHEILIVDDDRSILEVLKIGISEKGLKVVDFTSAEDALRSFESGRFRYALIDMKLPSMDGIELSQQIIKMDSNIIIILMTGYPDIRNVVEAIRSRIFDYLIKPFRLSQLFVVLEKAEQSILLNTENLELKATIEDLEKENQDLREKLKNYSPIIYKNIKNKFSTKKQAFNSYKKNQDNLLISYDDEE